jgi:hypothetical protein
MTLKTLKPSALCLTALLFTAATAAHASFQLPKMGVGNKYWCSYSSYTGDASNPGWSWWEIRTSVPAQNLYYTYEHFQTPGGEDNQKMTFAKPAYVAYGTRWETTTFDGVQCTQTDVLFNQIYVVFAGCNDGSTRTCYKL